MKKTASLHELLFVLADATGCIVVSCRVEHQIKPAIFSRTEHFLVPNGNGLAVPSTALWFISGVDVQSGNRDSLGIKSFLDRCNATDEFFSAE